MKTPIAFALILLRTGFAETQPFDLSRLDSHTQFREFLEPPTFDQKTAGLVEKQIFKISEEVEERCHSSQGPTYCWLPKIWDEYQKMGRKLLEQSTSRPDMRLGLFSQFHPTRLFYSDDSPRFDTQFSRFLIASILLRQVWPLLPKDLSNRAHSIYLLWLKALTPSQLLVNWQEYSENPETAPAELSENTLYALYNYIQSLPNEWERIEGYVRFSRSYSVNPQQSRVFDIFMEAVRGHNPGHLLYVASTIKTSFLSSKSVQEYFNHVDRDSTVPFELSPFLTGHTCQDLENALKTTLGIEIGFPASLNHRLKEELETPCSSNENPDFTMPNRILEALTEHHAEWRFNLFYLRLIIRNLFHRLVATSQFSLAERIAHEHLADFFEQSQRLGRKSNAWSGTPQSLAIQKDTYSYVRQMMERIRWLAVLQGKSTSDIYGEIR